MTVETLNSTGITNLDTVPVKANATGNGASGYLREVDGYATVSASASATSTYRLVRVPSNCKMKSLIWESEAMGAGKFNLSAYYSSSTMDGTLPANQGVIVPTTGDQFFASDIDAASAIVPTNYVNESGNYTLDKRGKALWDALGLSSDPGGYFDIVAVVHTTAVTTGAAKIGVRAAYVE